MTQNAADRDAALIIEVLKGNRESAHQLVADYQTPLEAFLTGILGNPHDAADAAQEALVKALRSLPSLEDPTRFKSWLFSIGWREAMNLLRKRKRLREVSMNCEELSAGAADAELEQQKRMLAAAIDGLPEAERQVVRLRLETQLTFREIAERTGAPLNTVLTRMHNAKQRLSTAMNHERT